ncbi:MAG: M20/M25/M40 family metallo-hydrolase, partial [Flavobacteriaceae bacterium]
MKSTLSYIQKNKKRFLEELFALIRIPSISADPAYADDMQKAAEKVQKLLEESGCTHTQMYPTEGYPVVYGECLIDPKLPTVLVYGHYDVQPPDPLDLWDNDPFDPIVKKTKTHPEGAIFARGACDDKGQFFMHLKALEVMLKTEGLPCNVKFMIEGEEEVGSDNLEAFVREHADLLSNDVILISDTGMLAHDTPSITTGLRGLSYMEVEVTGPNRDLHSGLYGGAVANPINILTQMIASLHDKNNHVTIPGFYDKVEVLEDADRKEIEKIPFSLSAYKAALDIEDIHGEEGYSTLERKSIRP